MSKTVIYENASSEASADHHHISPTLLGLLKPIASPGHFAIDVGCGEGRFTFAIAPYLAHVIGIDRDVNGIDAAQSKAYQQGKEDVTFFVADAEVVDYSEFLTFEPYDLVTAHLCMSEPIIQRAWQSLRPGGRFLFAALESRQWEETGHVSQFSFEQQQFRSLLEQAGFVVEFLGVETRVLNYPNPDELAARWLNGNSRPRWLNDDRIEGLRAHTHNGGKTFTVKSQLIGRAIKRKNR